MLNDILQMAIDNEGLGEQINKHAHFIYIGNAYFELGPRKTNDCKFKRRNIVESMLNDDCQ